MRRRLPVLLAIAALGSLAVAGARKPVDRLSKLGPGEVVVVGRVELVPALNEHEQRLRGIGTGKFENKMFLVIDSEYRELTEEPDRGDFKGRIDATLGEDFSVSSSAEPFYVIAGMMYLSLGHGAPDQAYFPGGLKAGIEPGDKAVYIGTIRYHRDEFFEISKVEIVDDYERARAEFVERFGDEHPLKKALLVPAP